jgi:hypothetical protein
MPMPCINARRGRLRHQFPGASSVDAGGWFTTGLPEIWGDLGTASEFCSSDSESVPRSPPHISGYISRFSPFWQVYGSNKSVSFFSGCSEPRASPGF